MLKGLAQRDTVILRDKLNPFVSEMCWSIYSENIQIDSYVDNTIRNDAKSYSCVYHYSRDTLNQIVFIFWQEQKISEGNVSLLRMGYEPNIHLSPQFLTRWYEFQ